VRVPATVAHPYALVVLAERPRAWDRYPTAYSIFNPQIIPGFESTYMARYTIGAQFRALSDPYLDWIEQCLPDSPLFLILNILPAAAVRTYSRRTREGFTIGVTRPVSSYTEAASEEAMARLADSDFALFEAVIVRRWRTRPPPVIDYPDAEDVDSWRRLGRLMRAGESREPLIELWRRGELDPR
jgi:hypothetical protein